MTTTCITRVFAVTLGAPLALAATSAGAQQDMPNIEGTWVITDGRALLWNGSSPHMANDYQRFEIAIPDQGEGVFNATNLLYHEEEGTDSGHHGEDEIVDGSYPLLGVIGWDGTTVVFTDINDHTSLMCQLTDPDTMGCIGWEAGERALVSRFVMTRAPE